MARQMFLVVVTLRHRPVLLERHANQRAADLPGAGELAQRLRVLVVREHEIDHLIQGVPLALRARATSEHHSSFAAVLRTC